MRPRYTISVVCFNNLALTKACLKSVMAQSDDYELIVTDNNSMDGTGAYLVALQKNLGDRLRIITNKENRGFKDPNNHALTFARGEFFVCLNNDMEVCPNWLDKLQAPFATDLKLAITGLAKTCRVIDEKFSGQYHPSALDYIEGSCLMIPTAIARKHGLFSDYLSFAYWEDTDLSFRLRELGYNIAVVDLPMDHDKRGSTTRHVEEVQAHFRKNTETMQSRWAFYFKRRDFKRRILVRRLGARGDVLLATPILRALRNKYPQAEIEVATKCPEMLAGMDGVRPIHHSPRYFDQKIDLDLAYEKRPDLHIVHAYALAAGISVNRAWMPEMFQTEADMVFGERKSRGERVALIHSGLTCWPAKNWPEDRMKEVVTALKKMGYFTVAVGAEDAPECDCDDSLAGETTPQQLYALAKHARLFVGIDSMPQHVASAANLPSVVIFGPTNPYAIIRSSHLILPVQADVKEVPCVGAHGRRTKPVTQAPCEAECILAVTPEMVLAAVKRVTAYSK